MMDDTGVSFMIFIPRPQRAIALHKQSGVGKIGEEVVIQEISDLRGQTGRKRRQTE